MFTKRRKQEIERKKKLLHAERLMGENKGRLDILVGYKTRIETGQMTEVHSMAFRRVLESFNETQAEVDKLLKELE